jgi:hypothetical protein
MQYFFYDSDDTKYRNTSWTARWSSGLPYAVVPVHDGDVIATKSVPEMIQRMRNDAWQATSKRL